jgi:hypothetical protein
MNLIGRILLPLAAMLVLTQTVSSQTSVPEAEESCSCTCAYYLGEKDIPACQAQCDSGWKERQCADLAMPDMGEKDDETVRFEAEIRSRSQNVSYPMKENFIATQVTIFQASSPEYRQAIWDELEKNKVPQQQQDVADEVDLNAMSTDELEAEILRHKAAVEQLNLPPVMVEDMEGKDAETLRFEGELRSRSQSMRYPLQENVIASQVYIFQISAPEYRQVLWDELEKNTVQLAQQQQQEVADEAGLNAMPTDELDAETLRYMAAVKQLNLPPDMVEDLVEMFQANDAAFRKTMWQRVEESPPTK